jgi:hypothetical protein
MLLGLAPVPARPALPTPSRAVAQTVPSVPPRRATKYFG